MFVTCEYCCRMCARSVSNMAAFAAESQGPLAIRTASVLASVLKFPLLDRVMFEVTYVPPPPPPQLYNSISILPHAPRIPSFFHMVSLHLPRKGVGYHTLITGYPSQSARFALIGGRNERHRIAFERAQHLADVRTCQHRLIRSHRGIFLLFRAWKEKCVHGNNSREPRREETFR